VAKGLLPSQGLGSGIRRALAHWSEIDFTDDRDGCLFTVTVHRKELKHAEKTNGSPKSSPKRSSKSSPKSSSNTGDQILALIELDAAITTERLGEALGISKRAVLKQIDKLKEQGRLQRIGPAKGGYWEVISQQSWHNLDTGRRIRD
jgi:ATP-dependent DNA helicase RecG